MTSSYSWLTRSSRLGGVTALLTCAALLVPASGADAATSTTTIKKKLDQLNNQVDKLANQYDKSKTQLDAQKKRLAAVNDQVNKESPQYQKLRSRVAELIVTAYKNGTLDNTALAASNNPSAALEDMSAFTELANNRNQDMAALLASTQRLQRDRAEAQSALQTVAKTTASLKRQKVTVEKAIAKQKALLPKPTTSSSSSGGSSIASASSAGQKAANYAIAQLGKPYVFGGEGPSGFDCSGLTMAAWDYAGVNLPRIVPDQYAAITHISKSELRPGDLVFFLGMDHEGIYVGGGRFIHAPHTGTDVQYASMSNSYWVANYDGAGRP